MLGLVACISDVVVHSAAPLRFQLLLVPVYHLCDFGGVHLGLGQLDVLTACVHSVCVHFPGILFSDCFLGQARINSVHVVDYLGTQTVLGLHVLGQLVSRNEWRVFEVNLSVEPALVALAHVHDKVLLEPLLSLTSDLVEESIVDDIFNIGVNAVEHHLDVVLPPGLALVFRDVSSLQAGPCQHFRYFEIDSNDGQVQGVPSILVNSCQVWTVADEEFGHEVVVSPSRPMEWCPHVGRACIDVTSVFQKQLNNIPVT